MHPTPNQLLFNSQGSECKLMKFQPPRLYHSLPLVEIYRSFNACHSDKEMLCFCVGNTVLGTCVGVVGMLVEATSGDCETAELPV